MADLHLGNDDLAYARGVVEWATNSSPTLSIDWSTYAQVQAWCQYPDKVAVILATLTERLSTPAPSSFKAIIFLQALSPASLVSLIPKIEPLSTTTDNPYIANIALSLLDAARKEKVSNEEAGAKYKWDLWAERYGQSAVGWVPLPVPPEPAWAWYGMRWVGPDEWWVVRSESTDGQ